MKKLFIIVPVGVLSLGLVYLVNYDSKEESLPLMESGIETSAEPDEEEQMAENVDGIHIMPDGAVMDGEGEVIPGASVRADGMIELEDGRIVEPVMDLRTTQ